jgi:hypothetical protein
VFFLSTAGFKQWNPQLTSINNWLWNLKREAEAEDLWASIREETGLADIAIATHLDDNPFNADEISNISKALSEIREYIRTIQALSVEQAAFVTEKLAYLEELSKKQGRQAWIHTAIGVLFAIVVGAALAPDAARELFKFAAKVLGPIINHPIALP